ncbi:MAG: radical SAM protein [Candidatus Nanopelagicales bacterium]
MKLRTWGELGWFGMTTVLLRRKDPIVGSIIITDRCNLACKHCAVGNIRRTDYPYPRVLSDMRSLHASGVRILFLYGGEPFLWHDRGATLRDLVLAARDIGFLLVNIVTNGTHGLAIPEADLILVSLDGTREHHDEIRGHNYDRVLESISAAPADNLCLYMAINRINRGDIEQVCQTALSLDHVKAVSFNFHTPYPGTEHLTLSLDQRRECCVRIRRMMDLGYPVLNMPSALPYIAENSAKVPCYQCVVVEDGQQWACGRCIDIPGLCQECGYFFAAELSLLFSGNPRVVIDALRTYRRFL